MMKVRMMKIVVPALLALVCTSAHAEEAWPSIRVAHADLDLTSAEGRAALDQRIRQAVQYACSTGPYRAALMPARWSCISDFSASAKARARALISAAERNSAGELAAR